jgi:hypothetical protein
MEHVRAQHAEEKRILSSIHQDAVSMLEKKLEELGKFQGAVRSIFAPSHHQHPTLTPMASD